MSHFHKDTDGAPATDTSRSLSARDCSHEGSPKRRVCSKGSRSKHGSTSVGREGVQLLHCRQGPKLQGTTSVGRTLSPRLPLDPFISFASLSLLSILLFLCFGPLQPTLATPVNAQVLSPTDPLVLHLLDLCRSDLLCTQKWFLPPPPQLDPASDNEKAKFTRLLIIFSYKSLNSPDGTLVTVPSWQSDPTLLAAANSDPLVQASLEANEDAYWLLLLRSAVFCGGLPNQDFLLGRGCICVPGAVCSEGSGSFDVLQFVALVVILLVCVISVAWNLWQILQDSDSTLRLATDIMTAINISRSAPAVDLSVKNKNEYAPASSVDIEGWMRMRKDM